MKSLKMMIYTSQYSFFLYIETLNMKNDLLFISRVVTKIHKEWYILKMKVLVSAPLVQW